MLETWRWKNEQLTRIQAASAGGGEDAFRGWNPNWLPVALDDSGCRLLVELRLGELHRAVGQTDPESPPRFDGINTHVSTAALLEHTADALHGNGTATPSVQNHGIRRRRTA